MKHLSCKLFVGNVGCIGIGECFARWRMLIRRESSGVERAIGDDWLLG
jgi:hypothetical protein